MVLDTANNSNNPFLNIYLHCISYGGPLFAFYYKEVTYKNEYYFYFNKGIRKEQLLIFTAVFYIITGNVILLIINIFQNA